MKKIGLLKSKFIAMPAELSKTFFRFPLSVLSAVVFYVLLSADAHTTLNIDERLLLTLPLGFVLFAAFELVLESFDLKRLPYRVAAAVVGLGALIIHYYIVTDYSQRDMSVFFISLTGAVLIAALGVNFKNGKNFEVNVARLISRLFTSVLFATVFVLGLLAVIAVIDLLLTNVDSEAYFEVARIGYSLFFPIMFLKGVPKEEEEAEFPKLLKGLLRFVIIPIMLVFTLVLYLYYVKLIFEQNLPISEVGGVSLAFLGIGIPATILITQFEDKILKVVRKYFPYILIPVIGVLFLADIKQLSLYGVTMTRYLVAVGGIAALVAVVLICTKGGKFQRFSLLVAAVLCLISAYGPISAYNLSSKSQSARLEYYLTKNDMLIENAIKPNENISDTDKEEIKSIILYINRYDLDKPEYLEEMGSKYEENLGFSMDYHYGKNSEHFHAERDIIAINGYDYLVNYRYTNVVTDDYWFSGVEDSDTILIKKGDSILAEIPKSEIAEEIYSKIDKEKQQQSSEALSYTYENDKIKAKLMFSNISIYTHNEQSEYEHGNFTLLLKEK